MLDHAPVEHHYVIKQKELSIPDLKKDIIEFSKKLELDFYKCSYENDRIFIAGMLNAYNDVLHRLEMLK